jgi:hypothetical protein
MIFEAVSPLLSVPLWYLEAVNISRTRALLITDGGHKNESGSFPGHILGGNEK